MGIHLLSGWWGILPVHGGRYVLSLLLSCGAFLAAGGRFIFFGVAIFVAGITPFLYSFGFPRARLGWGLPGWGARLDLVFDAGGATRLASICSGSSSFAGHTRLRAEGELGGGGVEREASWAVEPCLT